MQKKIMQVNITCGVGSTGKLSLAIYNATLESGYTPLFAYSTQKPSLKTAFKIENKLQNFLRRLLNRFFGRKQKHSTPGTKRLIRFIKKEKPDLIHLHNVQQNSVDFITFFSFLKTLNTPIIYTLHDCWAFTGSCYHFTNKNCEQYQTECLSCQSSMSEDDVTTSPKDTYQLKKSLVGANDNLYPICVSNWLREVATKSYMGKMKHPPKTVYNGIDTTLFSPTATDIRNRLGILDDELVILGISSYWGGRKSLSVFTGLIDKLSFPFKIVLVGSGLEQVKERFSNKIICIEKTQNTKELAEIYSMADVFINSSLEETFGLTTAEALSCGTPAIVFNSTACPEVIDENTGIIVSNDTTEIIQAVNTIREKGKQYYSSFCVKRIKENFSQEKMTEEYLKIYRSVLND